MKTFIWNTEYTVIVSVAKSLEDARNQLKLAYAQYVNVSEIDYIFNNKPSITLEAGESIIYDHSNE